MSQFNAFQVETYADSPTQTFIRNMRLWMNDFAGLNALLGGEEFKDYHFELFIDMALDDWAVTPPLLRRYTAVEDFPSKYLLMLCVAVIALESAAMLYARNNLNYSDGGITVALPQDSLFDVSKQFGVRFGTLHPLKGPLATKTHKDGIVIYSWDYVDRCVWNLCSAHLVCHFYDDKKNPPVGGACKIMHYMMKGAALTMFDFDTMSKLDIWRVGMHLLPLYRLYCKLLIAEAGEPIVLYRDKQNRLCMNPIHKAISDMAEKISREVTKLQKEGKALGFELPRTIDVDFAKPKTIVRRKEVANIKKVKQKEATMRYKSGKRLKRL